MGNSSRARIRVKRRNLTACRGLESTAIRTASSRPYCAPTVSVLFFSSFLSFFFLSFSFNSRNAVAARTHGRTHTHTHERERDRAEGRQSRERGPCRELIRARDGGGSPPRGCHHASSRCSLIQKRRSTRFQDASPALPRPRPRIVLPRLTADSGGSGGRSRVKTWALRNKMDAPVSVCLSRGKATEARRAASRRGIVRAPLHPFDPVCADLYAPRIRVCAQIYARCKMLHVGSRTQASVSQPFQFSSSPPRAKSLERISPPIR